MRIIQSLYFKATVLLEKAAALQKILCDAAA